MRLLLDTHVFLWLNGAPEKLSPKAFDRLLIAQALVEDLTFVTVDKQIVNYSVSTLW